MFVVVFVVWRWEGRQFSSGEGGLHHHLSQFLALYYAFSTTHLFNICSINVLTNVLHLISTFCSTV
jgi:hypothetical protein